MEYIFPEIGLFSLVGVIMLILSSSSWMYLINIREKTEASRMMAWFFVCVSFSALATILANLRLPWTWALAPSQDGFLILGSLFLARFAYIYPAPAHPQEGRRVLTVFLAIAVVALGYSIYFGIQYLGNIQANLDEIQAYYLLTPITVLALVGVMLYRSATLSRQAIQGRVRERPSAISLLLKPRDPTAYGFRNLALAFSVALVPLVVFLIKPYISGVITSFAFNFGVVLAISAVMLVYLNMTVEYTSVMAKLVGVSLVAVLLVLGGICTTLIHFSPIDETHLVIKIFIGASILSAGLILGLFPIFFNDTVVDPLNRLLTGVRAANQGDLGIKVNVKFKDELGFLTESFNQMVLSLRELSTQLREKADRLESANVQQTEKLLEENQQRKQAEARLNRQLAYENALANCSRILVESAESQVYRKQLLDQALVYLREGVRASRAYVFEFFNENESELMRMVAEACAPGIPAQIDNQANQRFPVVDFPDWFLESLKAGNQLHGLTEELLGDHPLLEEFLNQEPPLLSAILFPIFIEGTLWGYIGFDDCVEPREWSPSAVNYLGIASEIMGSTIKRWDISDQLNANLDELEEKVHSRTRELRASNEKLREEILQRRYFQNELEHRLKSERILARSAARLVETGRFEEGIQPVLENLAGILNAGLVSLIFNRFSAGRYQPEQHQWLLPQKMGLDAGMVELLMDGDGWVYSRITSGDPLIVGSLDELPDAADKIKTAAASREIHSFAVWPLITGDLILGLLVICNTEFYKYQVKETFQSLELFVEILTGVLEREGIVQNLENMVTEQTREISSLYEITLMDNVSADLAEILYPALLRVRELSRSEAGCIYNLDSNEKNLQLVTQQGLPLEMISGMEQIPVTEGVLEWLECPDPDYGLQDQLQEDIPDQLFLPGFGTYFISRVRALGASLGILVCYRKNETTFSPFQISILAVVGELLGAVVKNYHLAIEMRDMATIEERQRLARELHDAVSQSLYSISLFARAARDAQESGDEGKLSDSLLELEENSLSALREMRLLLYQLRSLALDEEDLGDAILSRINMVERRVGIDARVEIAEQINLKDDLEQDLFRIITEALNNSLRYAEAKQIQIELVIDEDELVLSIQDDGVGFEAGQIQQGMGLDNIRDRAGFYGGSLVIDSSPGRGTELQIRIPERNIS